MKRYAMEKFEMPFGITRRYWISSRGCALCASAALLYLLSGDHIEVPVLDFKMAQGDLYNMKDEIIWDKLAKSAGYKCETWLYDGKKKAKLDKLPVPCIVSVDGKKIMGYQSHFVVAVAKLENDVKIFDPMFPDIKLLSFYPGENEKERIYSVIRFY